MDKGPVARGLGNHEGSDSLKMSEARICFKISGPFVFYAVRVCRMDKRGQT